MWPMLAPLLEGILKVALELPEARAWLGPTRSVSLMELRSDLDDECQRKGW
jgi:hypothetical protein